ncbi:hypothetical protein QWJ34_11490 [Saccharibacillus sp. CPCC 101409]|uniref:hypothetical protein n=1 Tax=Saccharibacillus sp. CPCC 101409 TaxID=3058041 RepID=UPI00267211A8|nr:hypothetical protein [Saccharibacillus sp. CPCC 101409]MDO3410386.1 hypothetical protein [Saccharibacillus sp. CPCC 101409]
MDRKRKVQTGKTKIKKMLLAATTVVTITGAVPAQAAEELYWSVRVEILGSVIMPDTFSVEQDGGYYIKFSSAVREMGFTLNINQHEEIL